MRVRIHLIILLLLCLTFDRVRNAQAFHDGGTAPCEGCHTIHNSAAGMPVGLIPGQGNPSLLLGSSSSAVCLICHEGNVPAVYRVASAGSILLPGSPPAMMTPGGDFAWLKKSYSWTVGTSLLHEPGDLHGHNIIASDFGYFADPSRSAAPGGSYPSASLHCSSCHDPHGRYRVRADGTVDVTGSPISASGSLSFNGAPRNPDAQHSVGSYRLLAGVGHRPSLTVPPLSYDPPAAMAPADYNRSETATQTRVAYGAGTSRWCANCHGEFHGDSGSTFRHPFEMSVGADIAYHYNTYVKTGDISGSAATSFSSLVPFEIPLSNSPEDRIALASLARSDDGNLSGPTERDRVGCLTCHRAHASGWRHALRWNHDSEVLVLNGMYPGLDNGAPPQYHLGRTEAETRRTYYDRPASAFAFNQNRLCEKCHEGGSP